MFLRLITTLGLSVLLLASAEQNTRGYFKISVVDEETGRGVPLVELRTTSELRLYTDSNGLIAFDEPGLMDRQVFFHLRSHGYEYPANGFGNRGLTLTPTRGGNATIRIKRLNVAERLYRITGEGIYRDSILLGQPAPLKQPLLSGEVAGQDGAHAIPYRGRIYWFWGDTNRVAHPLGNFGSSSATSEWPERGGLDPSLGVDFKYFVNASGFSREMCPASAIPGPGLRWLFWMMTVDDDQKRERLIAQYERIGPGQKAIERGMAILNDEQEGKEQFDRLVKFDLQHPLYPAGRPFRVKVDSQLYYYFATLYPENAFVRVKADLKHLIDQRSYEAFTPLIAGSRYHRRNARLERAGDGQLRYGWKADTDTIGYGRERELIATGRIKKSEAWWQLQDVRTGDAVPTFSGSVQWNEYRRRWVMIAQKNVGEIWYAEGDTPVGPWAYATRVVAHDRYTFYLPVHHPFFDQEGGRLIYFEGTYTNLFSGNSDQTPRYDYNQIMYRLRLDDPRLSLPAPVYLIENRDRTSRLLLREGVEAEKRWDEIREISFFALPPDRRREGMIPIYAAEEDHQLVLRRQATSGKEPLFYALPLVEEKGEEIDGEWQCQFRETNGETLPFRMKLRLDGEIVRGVVESGTLQRGISRAGRLELEVKTDEDIYLLTAQLQHGKLAGTWKRQMKGDHGQWGGSRTEEKLSPAVVPLYEYRRADGKRFYTTETNLVRRGWRRTARPICRVWRNPTSGLILDRQAQPVRFQ